MNSVNIILMSFSPRAKSYIYSFLDSKLGKIQKKPVALT